MPQDQVPIEGKSLPVSKVILLVEDDISSAQLIVDLVLRKTPHHVYLADSRGALRMADRIQPDIFLLNYHLSGTNGITLYDRLHAMKALEAVPAIIISTVLDQCKDEIERRHLVSLSKPFGVDDLLSLLHKVLASEKQ